MKQNSKSGAVSTDEELLEKGVIEILGVHLGEVSSQFLKIKQLDYKKQEKKAKRNNRFGFAKQKKNGYKKNDDLLGMDDDEEAGGLMGAERPQWSSTKLVERDTNKSEQLNQIKDTLGEIAQTFTRFSEMVSMQELMVRRIDEDSEMTLENAEKAKKEIVTHYNNISSYRKTIIKIFCFLMIFVFFYILFVV